MEARKLYDKLNKDFITDGITDDWERRITSIKTHITDEYNKTYMGLMIDNAARIDKVYTAVFLSDDVVKKAIQTQNSLIFVHHPVMWDLENCSDVFYPISIEAINEMKRNNVSVYNLHTPLDNYSEYGTSKTLADALGFEIIKPFAAYFGTQAGVICKSTYNNINELKNHYESILSHKVSLYNYGDVDISDKQIAIVAGGGNDKDVVNEMIEHGIDTLITGVSLVNDHSRDIHEFEKINKINILGGTHYSTEKFAVIKMCDYFKELGIQAEFIEDKPSFYDI